MCNSARQIISTVGQACDSGPPYLFIGSNCNLSLGRLSTVGPPRASPGYPDLCYANDRGGVIWSLEVVYCLALELFFLNFNQRVVAAIPKS